MHFENLQVNWEQLPRSESVELKPIERDYLKVLYLSWGIALGALLIALTVTILLVGMSNNLSLLLLSVIAYLLIVFATYFVGTKSFHRKAYAIREKDIVYRSGWIWQKLQVVPLNRIQHCVLHSGPIERKYGLASVSIHTAASDVHDISINGLKVEEAEQVKGYILQHIQPLH